MCFSFHNFFFYRKRISKPIEVSAQLINEVSKGDFTVKIPEKYLALKDETGKILRSLDNMVRSIGNMLTEVNAKSKDQLKPSLRLMTRLTHLKSL
jgi:methyl-accepting chemotaxis protein